jgi:hypothetical protein
MAAQRPPSIGASENAPFVSRPQGSYDYEMKAQHCDATRCAKHQSRAPTLLKKAMLAFFSLDTNDCAKVAFLKETPNLNEMSDPHREEFITKSRLRVYTIGRKRRCVRRTTRRPNLRRVLRRRLAPRDRQSLDPNQRVTRCSFTRRSSCAFAATMMVDTLIATAPTLIGRSKPQRTRTPPAIGMASRL